MLHPKYSVYTQVTDRPRKRGEGSHTIMLSSVFLTASKHPGLSDAVITFREKEGIVSSSPLMRQMNTDDGGEVNMFNLQTEVKIKCCFHCFSIQ